MRILVGLTISNVGSFAQFTAFAYVVALLAQRDSVGPMAIGLVALSRAIPTVALTYWSASILDVTSSRILAIGSNLLFAAQAFALFVMVSTKSTNLVLVCVLAAVAGVATTFEGPSRAAVVRDVVGVERYGDAYGAQMVAFNLPSLLLPFLVGIALDRFGASPAFLLNAVTTLALIWALSRIRESVRVAAVTPRPIGDIRTMYLAIRSSTTLSYVVIAQVLANATLVASQSFFALFIVETVTNTSGQIIGIMMSLFGAAAVLCGLMITRYAKRSSVRIIYMAIVFGAVTLTAAALATSLSMFLICATLSVFATNVALASCGVLGQKAIPESFKARFTFISVFCFAVVAPASTALIAIAAQRLDLHTVVAVAAVAAACVALGCSTLHDGAMRRSIEPLP